MLSYCCKYKLPLLAVGFVTSLFFYFPQKLAAKTGDNINSNLNANANPNSNTNALNAVPNSNDNANSTKRQEEIQKKQEQLDSVRTRVNTYEKRSDILEQKTDTLQDMLDALNSEIESTEKALQKTEKELAAIQQSLNDKEHEIILKGDNIDKRKKFLEEYVRKLDLLDKKSVVEIILEKPSVSDYFQEIENIIAFEQRLHELLAELSADRRSLLTEKSDIEEAKNEQVALYAMQEEQKIELDNNRKDRENLLKETQNEQGRIENLVERGNEVANRLASEITALQSLGTKIDFGQALEEAKAVAQLTSVRAAFLLGVLKVESNMGNNVGGGRYKTDMNPAQWDRFKNICNELGYSPNDRPVSRKPCYRDSKGNCGGWGGAMGPAQFMPSTWMGYKDQVAKVTGRNPPDPWSIRDALTAMGLKLSKVDGVTSHDRKAEHKAASIYLAGGNWERFGWYGDRVLKYADAYDKETNKN